MLCHPKNAAAFEKDVDLVVFRLFPHRLSYWEEQYGEYKKLANKSLNRANRRFFGKNSIAATQGKFYSTLRGFIIAQLRKTTE